MKASNKQHFFYHIPPDKPTEIEDTVEQFSFYSYMVGIVFVILAAIATEFKLFHPVIEKSVIAIGIGSMGISIIVFSITNTLKNKKYLKKFKRYSSEFDTTLQAQIIKSELKDNDSEGNDWGCDFYLFVQNPNTEEIVSFYIMTIQKHLSDCQKLFDTYESTKTGFEVTLKLHPTEKDMLCLVLHEDTSPYLHELK